VKIAVWKNTETDGIGTYDFKIPNDILTKQQQSKEEK
jgi:hypothetical protein